MRNISLALGTCLLGSTVLLVSCHTDGAKPAKTATQPPPQAAMPSLTPAKPAPNVTTPSKAKASQPAPKRDAVDETIALAETEYARGQANYRAGHLEAAKDDFDRAFNILLQGKTFIHQDERLENEFDKVVEAVHGLEMQALKEGDGFTEQRSEPAPIDEANDVTFPVDPAVRAKAEAEVRQTRSDLPLVMNDYVASFVSYFSSSTKGHNTVANALVRSGRYRDMIARVLKEEGVPQDLMFLAQAESGFHPMALSKAGARGMWQFMASRASGYGLQRNWWVDERQDPEKSTRAAARHLRDLYNQFGDWYLAMAAYNSGPGTVQHAVERTGYADFWELYRRNVLPGETRNYVPIIVAMTIVAKNPAQYGLDRLQLEAPLRSEVVKIDYPVDLRLVSECVDVSVNTLQELNPSLLRMTTPKDMAFDLRLPVGTAAKFEEAIAAIPQEKRTYWRYHKVQSGETLTEIARKYRTTSSAIAEVNNLREGDDLRRDQKLVIPVAPSRAAAATTASSGNGSGSTNASASSDSGDSETVATSKRAVKYRVRKGDSILSVADDYGVSADNLRKWNHLRGNQLKAGRTLTIYKTPTVAKNSDSSDSPRASRKNRSSRTAAAKKGTRVVDNSATEDDQPQVHARKKGKGSAKAKLASKKSADDEQETVSSKSKKSRTAAKGRQAKNSDSQDAKPDAKVSKGARAKGHSSPAKNEKPTSKSRRKRVEQARR